MRRYDNVYELYCQGKEEFLVCGNTGLDSLTKSMHNSKAKI